MKQLATLTALAMFLAGCAQISAVDPGKPANVGDGVSVMPQLAWNQIGKPNQMLWTVNGIGLDELHFHTGIKSGEPISEIPGVKPQDLALYNSTMLPSDLHDLIVSDMVKEGELNVRTSDLAPCPFGEAKGVCFDISFATKDGLERKGRVLAAIHKGLLDVFIFQAPAEYYYDQYADSVDKLFASLQVQ